MKERKKIALRRLACLAAVLAYFFLSWTPLQTELQLRPEWTSDISKTPESAGSETLLPFRLGKKGGYFTGSGKIAACLDIPYKATFSKNFYALYENGAQSVRVMSPGGEERCLIEAAGFPFVQEDRIFLFEPGGASFAFVNNASGAIESEWEHPAPITAFNSSAGGSVSGCADGSLTVFDKYGRKTMALFPGGSDYPVILGADVSRSGTLFACVSGLEPQRFVLYRDEENYEKIIYHEFLKAALTRQTKVHFSGDGRRVYFDAGGTLGAVDTESAEAVHIPLSGTVADIQESPVGQSVFVLSRRDKGRYDVTILEGWTKKAGGFSFEAESAFILADGNTLYVGRDNKISRITVSKS